MEQIRSGMVALEREIRRLEKIKLVIKDVVQILQDLVGGSECEWIRVDGRDC